MKSSSGEYGQGEKLSFSTLSDYSIGMVGQQARLAVICASAWVCGQPLFATLSPVYQSIVGFYHYYYRQSFIEN
jgi:hypothetical protein